MHPAHGAALEMTWEPEKSDIRTAARKGLANRTAKVVWIVVVCVMGMCLSLNFLLVLITGTFDADFRTVASMVAIIAFVVAPKLLPAVLAQLAWWISPAARATVRARIDPSSGIRVAQGASSAVHGWSAVRRILETDKLFLVELFAIKGYSIVLPKRGLTHPGQVEDLRYLLQPFLERK